MDKSSRSPRKPLRAAQRTAPNINDEKIGTCRSCQKSQASLRRNPRHMQPQRPGATRCPSINKNLAAATFHLRQPRDFSPLDSARLLRETQRPQRLCVVPAALSLPRSSFPFNFQRPIIAISLLLYFFTSLLLYFFTSFLPYFASSSRKHSSNVFTANSAWTSSITSGGQNRTVVSPDPRISRPL